MENLDVLIKNLKMCNFDAYLVSTKEEAKKKALELISPGETVTWGGSATISEIGLLDAVKNGDYRVLDRANVAREKVKEFYRNAFFADTYLMSANAISLEGILVNIDGTANRVAALSYGPDKVIVLAGKNKIQPDLEHAVKRAREIAAPKNAQRFEINTPCKKTGECHNCKSDDCICAQILITRMCKPKGRIKVIIFDEEAGF